MIEPVRPIAIEDVEEARGRIRNTVLRTPLVKIDLGSSAPEIWLKLENLQPTNAYKIRGATNAVARLSDEQRAKGRLDDQRRQRGTRCRICCPAVRRAELSRCDRDGAEDEARTHASAWCDHRARVLRASLGCSRGA